MHPTFPRSYDELSNDPRQRVKQLQDTFGAHIVEAIQQSLYEVQGLIDSEPERERLGAIRAEPYVRVAALDPVAQTAALELTKAGIRVFAQHILTLLDNEGISLSFGSNHHVQYRFLTEIVETATSTPIEEVEINHSPNPLLGKQFFRWLAHHQQTKEV
jgi:hypothetical protein